MAMIRSDVELGLNFSIINAMPLTNCGNANEKRATSQPYHHSRANTPEQGTQNHAQMIMKNLLYAQPSGA